MSQAVKSRTEYSKAKQTKHCKSHHRRIPKTLCSTINVISIISVIVSLSFPSPSLGKLYIYISYSAMIPTSPCNTSPPVCSIHSVWCPTPTDIIIHLFLFNKIIYFIRSFWYSCLAFYCTCIHLFFFLYTYPVNNIILWKKK